MVYPNGDSYEGHFKNDVFHGEGTFRFAKQSEEEPEDVFYQGQWSEGLRQGRATMVCYPNGDKYEGDYANDVKEGKGRYVNA